jgi:putative ABC transport system ATP-binding protein
MTAGAAAAISRSALVGATPQPALRLSDVAFSWRRGDFSLRVPAFSVERGRRVLLTGPSGAGKSTLLNLICGVVSPEEGAVEVLGTDLKRLPRAGRDRFRAEHIGVVFQMFNLVPYLSIIDNVLLPLRFAPERARRARDGGGEEAEARRLLAALALDPSLHPRPVTVLSVGQQQRAAAARALVGGPELVIADEPTSALDQDRQAAFLSLLFGELERIGATLIMVSHDVRLGSQFDDVVRLDAVATVSDGAGERGSRA